VKSYNPLVIYFYDEGLVRFATAQYDIGDASLKNVFSHLTNTSINKFSPTIDTYKDGIGSGCKWKFNRLNSYFASKNIDHEKIWKKIKAIVILTLLPVAPEVTINQDGCFELYGFDILIDENFKPWLLGRKEFRFSHRGKSKSCS
jgi:tubulin polyglutamylase TTLL2